MKKFHAALSLSSFLAIAGAVSLTPTISSAQPVAETTYVACNSFGDCWRVHRLYAYGEAAPIIYHDSAWYDAHLHDTNVHWLADPAAGLRHYQPDGGGG